MAYSDIQDRLGQQQMANSVLLAEKYSQGNLFPKGSEGNPYSKNPRAEGARKKREYKKAQEEKIKAKEVSENARKREWQRRKDRGEVARDMPPDFNLMENLGPSINKLLQIGGAVGGGLRFLTNPLGNAMASTPQDGRAPTRLFYNDPYDEPKMFIKDKQTIEDAKERFKWNKGIDLANFPYEFAGGVVTPRYFTPPRYSNQPFIHIRTKDIKDEELFHFNNFIRSMGGGLDTVSRQTPLSIAGLPYSPPIERMVVGKKMIDSPLRFRTDAERIRLMEDFAKYDRPRT